MDDHCKNLSDVILNSIQLLVLLVSALWAYFRFRKEDPLLPRIEFEINCQFFGPQQNSYLAAFIITANNKGNVEHRFSEIRLKVRGIKAGETLSEFKDFAPMVNFPVEIIKGVNIVPTKFGYFFVRPGVNQTFNYATQIPEHICFIIVRATFKYEETDELHTAERVFEVKTTKND
jgi:hypothetical protein